MHRLRLLTSVAVSAAVLTAMGAPACAQAARDFDIPPAALADALNRYAAQADRQIFFSGDLVAGLSSAGLRGRYTPEAALDRLLAGTGLAWSESRPGVIYLRRAVSPTVPVAQLEEIVVTGALVRSSGPPSSPVLQLDRGDLDARGFATAAEALAALPQNYAGSGTPGALLGLSDPAGGNSALATGVNLRGLGTGATLTLVDGRRLAGTGSRGAFADASALPSGAVERIDVLLDGASALYGADAVAGVVNIVMRRTFDGQETRLRLGAAEGGAEDVTASHLVGRIWTGGGLVAAYERQSARALNAQDRSYTATGDLRPFGGSDRRGVFATPGNIVAYDPAVQAYVSQWAVRPALSGAAETPTDFAAGEANRTGVLTGVDLVPEVRRDSVYVRLRQDIGSRFEASADLRFSRRAFGFDNAATSTVFAVSAANPHFVSPSGDASHLMAYSFYGDLGPSRRKGVSRSLGLTAGGVYDLGGGWRLDGYLAFAEERGEARTENVVNSAFLAEALGNLPDDPATAYSASRDGYFNPFGAGEANNGIVLDFLGQGYSAAFDRSRLTSANLLATGPFGRLPGGAIDVALGAQVRRESLRSRLSAFVSSVAPVDTINPARERIVTALFAEARLPLVGEANARRGVERLELTLAGRIEDYDDFGSTANPKVGLVWSPAPAWRLRLSYGRSFRAPGLTQMFDASATSVTTVPRADGASVLALYRYGGNPDLEAETAATWTAGFDWRRDGARFSLNYFDTGFSDRISQPVNENLAGVLVDPALSPFVQIVDPANDPEDLALVRSYVETPGFPYAGLYPLISYGAILDARWVNAARVDVRGVDLDARYPLPGLGGAVGLDASASYLFDFDLKTTPTAEAVSMLGQPGYPVRLRSRLGLSGSRGPVSASLHWNHVAAYEDRTGRGIDAWNTADLHLTWSPPGAVADNLQVALHLRNLFDEDPPFYDGPQGLGFDPGQADILGRTVSLQLIRRW